MPGGRYLRVATTLLADTEDCIDNALVRATRAASARLEGNGLGSNGQGENDGEEGRQEDKESEHRA